MKKEFQKPISMVMKETRDSIINVINMSHLPISIIELILKDMYSDIRVTAEVEYKATVQQYNKQIEQMNKSVQAINLEQMELNKTGRKNELNIESEE